VTSHLTRAGGRGVTPDAAVGGVPPAADDRGISSAVDVAGMASAAGVAGMPSAVDVAGMASAVGVAGEQGALVAAFLRREAARVLDVDPARLAEGRSLIAQGLDSLGAAELAAAIEAGLGVPVSFASLLEGASLAELGELVAARLAGEEAAARAALGAVAATADAPPAAPAGGGEPATAAEEADVAARRPLSHGQRALWLLDRMVAGGNPACVLAGAARAGSAVKVWARTWWCWRCTTSSPTSGRWAC
jgi:aryl carrier-like protein